jgi:hypothetical protein
MGTYAISNADRYAAAIGVNEMRKLANQKALAPATAGLSQLLRVASAGFGFRGSDEGTSTTSITTPTGQTHDPTRLHHRAERARLRAFCDTSRNGIARVFLHVFASLERNSCDLRALPHATYGCDECISLLAGAGRSERLRVAIVPRELSAQEISAATARREC